MEMLQEEPYRSNLIGFIIDEAHCVKKGYVNVYTICSSQGRLFYMQGSKHPYPTNLCDGFKCNCVSEIEGLYCHHRSLWGKDASNLPKEALQIHF